MLPDGRDFKGKFYLLVCSQCKKPGRVERAVLEAAAVHVQMASRR
jgi:hypothetical protein